MFIINTAALREAMDTHVLGPHPEYAEPGIGPLLERARAARMRDRRDSAPAGAWARLLPVPLPCVRGHCTHGLGRPVCALAGGAGGRR